MKKNLYYAVLGGMLAFGLSFAYTQAVEYTIDGSYTQISIPESDIEGVTVNRGDGNESFDFSLESEYCTTRNINTINYIRCYKDYGEESGEHTVSLDGVNNIFTIYLDDANIKTLTDFNGFTKLKNLYLDNNPQIQLDQSTFPSAKLLNLTYLSLRHNELNEFPSTLRFANIRVDLQYNKLTTVPESLLDYYTSDITLQNGTNYYHNGGSTAYKRDVDLRNNPINFINIPNTPDEEDTSYTFQWFAYSNSGYTEFEYRTDFTATGTTTENEVTINNFQNGSHYFTVCYSNDDTACDTVNFTIDLPNSLTITSPNGTDLTAANQTFSREGQHPYKAGYCYEFSKDEGSYTTIQECPTNNTSFTVDDLRDGNYTLKISMRDSTNNIVGDELIQHYNVNLHRVVIINRADEITTKNYTFSRYGNADDFIKYTYSLTNDDSTYSTSGETTSTSFNAQNLKDGNYTLTVTIVGEGGSEIDVRRNFTVNINRELEVDTSLVGNNITLNNVTGTDVTVHRTGSSERFNYYEYELKRNNVHYKSGSSTQLIDNVLYRRLPSGTYDFLIDMYDEDNELITTNNISFTIDIPANLTINSPTAGTQPNNITFDRNGFAENFDHYEYILERTDGGSYRKTGTGDQSFTQFSLNGLHHGVYKFTVNINDSSSNAIITKDVSFSISDDLALTSSITSNGKTIAQGGTGDSNTATFSWEGRSEDFAGYYYSIIGTTTTGRSYTYTGKTLGQREGSVTLLDLSSGNYRFTIKMLDSDDNEITSNTTDFNVVIPASLKITSPSNGTTVTSSSATFTWTGFSDTITKYDYELTGQPIQSTTSTSFSTTSLKNGDYTFTVWLYSGGNPIAQDSINFTVDIPVKVSNGGGSSSKTHYNNNLKLSLGNDSPAVNEWVKLLVKIDDKYTGKVSFPKLQHYSPETEKWEDIPVTSKNYVSDYSDEAKLGYIKFSSDDSGRKSLSQFIKFSKNGYYRIYAEDKDGYDTYIEFKVSNAGNTQKVTQTVSDTTSNDTTSNVDSIIQKYIPDVLPEDTSEEVYIARSCKKYTIRYSESLNVYTSPNLNMSEYFVSKDYFKRYVDSKNKYQSGCPTNIGWISTNYSDKTNDNSRYTAPNGKVYFITGQDGNYYSNELNKELKTPTSFKTIQELKYYIRDRNPLINMATLGPTK